MAHQDPTRLTDRELEVLQHVATGASNRQIGRRLEISPNTVKVHLRNIYSKLGVASRTEATMYAIQAGLIDAIDSDAPTEDGSWLQRYWPRIAAAVLLLVGIPVAVLMVRQAAPVVNGVPPEQFEDQRWVELAPMSNPRKGLAAVAYDGKVYAIGGETESGVTDAVERYDQASDSWETLPRMLNGVADARCVVIGGTIYVPGGRLASGEISKRVQTYDISTRTWKYASGLPIPLSRYAAVAVEGEIIVFGGWTGTEFSDQILRYQQEAGAWQVVGRLPSPRADLDAALSGDRIYIAGVADESGSGYLASYNLSSASEAAPRWRIVSELPANRTGLATAGFPNVVYVVAGPNRGSYIQQYIIRSDEWRVEDAPSRWPAAIGQGVVADGEFLYLIGGEVEGQDISTNLRYRALFTLYLPLSPNQR